MGQVVFYTQAYNADKYIKKCIESVLRQTYSDFRYYLIDNGSTDDTWKIINEYAEKDSRILPVHLSTNTTGILEKYIRLAYENGYEYIATLDADDWYEATFLDKMLNVINETNSDLVTCATALVFENGQMSKVKRPKNEVLIIDNKDFAQSFPYIYQYYGAIWGRLYKTRIFVENNISGNKSIKYGIDTLFVLDYQKNCRRVAFYPEPLHNYYIRSNSVSYTFNKKALESNENYYKSLYQYLESIRGLSKFNLEFISSIFMQMVTNTKINILICDECTYEEKVDILYKTFTSEITKECWSRLNSSDKTARSILNIDGNYQKWHKVLFEYICSIYNNKDNKKYYEMICFLLPTFKDMCDENEIGYWLEYPEFLLSLMNIETHEVILKLFSALSNKQYNQIALGALKKLNKSSVTLDLIGNQEFASYYSSILADLYNNKYSEAMDSIIEILTGKGVNPFKEELIHLCMNISSLTNETDVFLYAKKLESQLFIDQERYDEASAGINLLIELSPDDDEVKLLKKQLEVKNA